MFFDVSLQAFDIQIIPVEEESHLILQFLLGLVVPGPQGQKGVLPAGAIKVPVGRDMAITKAKELLEAAEALPEPKPDSGLIVPNDANEAQALAQQQAQMNQAFRSDN
jgi:hypothetical protein